MSALGQKQTFAVQEVMSALPLKADMCGATRDVRFGPKADIPANRSAALKFRRRVQRAYGFRLPRCTPQQVGHTDHGATRSAAVRRRLIEAERHGQLVGSVVHTAVRRGGR